MIKNLDKLKQRHKEIKKHCIVSEEDYAAFEEKKQLLTLISKIVKRAMVIRNRENNPDNTLCQKDWDNIQCW